MLRESNREQVFDAIRWGVLAGVICAAEFGIAMEARMQMLDYGRAGVSRRLEPREARETAARRDVLEGVEVVRIDARASEAKAEPPLGPALPPG